MFFNKPPAPELKVAVIIPVKDEATTVCATLDALKAQTDNQGYPLNPESYEVLVLANNCRDDTYNRIRDYSTRYRGFSLQVEAITFPDELAHVGTARRLLMDMAYNRFLHLGRTDGIIASTDGDSRADTCWIWELQAEIARGCDVVGGIILTDTEGYPATSYHVRDICYQNLIAHIEHLIDPQPHNPWPSHFQCFGANFSITCGMYARAGRLPERPYLEDVAFNEALERHDARIRKSPQVRVYTSARKSGRVERGLSQQLAYFEQLEHHQKPLLVESSEAIIARLKIRKKLRETWRAIRAGRPSDETLAGIPLPPAFRRKETYLANTFGSLWQKALACLDRKSWFAQWPAVEIDRAIADLKAAEITLLQADSLTTS